MALWSLETKHGAKTHHTPNFYLKWTSGGGDYCLSYGILPFVQGPTTGTIGVILESSAKINHPANGCQPSVQSVGTL